MTGFISLFREIRERRIFQIFVTYAAVGWAALQVLSNLVQHGILPEVMYLLGLIWYAGGFPGALLIGWFHGERGDQKAPKLEVFSLSIIGIVCLGVSSAAVSNHYASRLAVSAAEQGMNLQRVAVLYFKDITRGGELQYLADGITEDLIEELERVDALDVISRNGVAQFRDADVPQDSIAEALEAGTLVDGTVERVGDKVRVNIRLADALSGAEFKRAAFEHPVEDVFAVRDEVARETSRLLREWLGEEIQLRRLAQETRSPVAWALFQRAEKLRKDAEALHHRGDHAGMAQAFQRADSLLGQAERIDTAWVKPVVLRGTLAYRQSRLANGSHEALRWIGVAMGHAERALARSPREAEALELRGTVRYWHWILHATPDPGKQANLLKLARQDLERAVELDPRLAGAHSTLSHLYYRDDIPSAVLAARRAYEEDGYLEMTNEVLWRLFHGSYDIAQFTQAQRWCDEGAKRFPQDYRFAACQLQAMTTPAAQPDPDEAWRLLARIDSLAPPERRGYFAAWGQLWVGGVLARAHLPDSARAVLLRGRVSATPEADPLRELHTVEAYVRTMLGDYEEAVDLLTRYAAVNPRFSFEHHWWWQGLRSRPDFAPLQADH